MGPRIELWLKYHESEFKNSNGLLDYLAFAEACIQEFGIEDRTSLEEIYSYCQQRKSDKSNKFHLRDLRKRAGFTSHKNFAQASGLAPSTVWLAETGASISKESAEVMLETLHRAGIEASIDDIDWKISEIRANRFLIEEE